MKLEIPEYILGIDPYKPGKPMEELEREYGIRDSIKLASNENPLGPSPKALEAARACLDAVHRYPDGRGWALVSKIAAKFDLQPDNIVLGNGSDEIIGMLTRVLLQAGDEVILPQPTFSMYDIMVRSVGANPVPVPLDHSLAIDLPAMRSRLTPRTRMVFLCNPNNPTGTVITRKQFEAFLHDLPAGIVVVIDEAYIEFVTDPDCVRGTDYLREEPAVVLLRTFSKAYGLAGLRIGYAVMPAKLSGYIHRVRQPFNTALPAQVAAAAALADDAFLQRTLQTVHAGLAYLQRSLDRLGVRHYPTQSNFFLVDVQRSGDEVFEQMLRKGVIVRSMSSYGFADMIRINVGLPLENERFIQALSEVLGIGSMPPDGQ
ncbi:MAG: histidinol-phosphate aminotransferase [Deltaproteobacteria bacterium SG8_13]|nr:MAG: histidinol-phosphate aminotransferase [Deltaproteobacteria bacterium SG8_13]